MNSKLQHTSHFFSEKPFLSTGTPQRLQKCFWFCFPHPPVLFFYVYALRSVSLALSLRGFPSCSKIPEAFSTAGTAGKRLKAGGLKWKCWCLLWKGCVLLLSQGTPRRTGTPRCADAKDFIWTRILQQNLCVHCRKRCLSEERVNCAAEENDNKWHLVCAWKSAFPAPNSRIWLEPLGQRQSCPQLLERHCWERIAAGERVRSQSESRDRPNESKLAYLHLIN